MVCPCETWPVGWLCKFNYDRDCNVIASFPVRSNLLAPCAHPLVLNHNQDHEQTSIKGLNFVPSRKRLCWIFDGIKVTVSTITSWFNRYPSSFSNWLAYILLNYFVNKTKIDSSNKCCHNFSSHNSLLILS